jgi:poly-gamma-glutamate synthesis protein (capsule biosynthesis protein)
VGSIAFIVGAFNADPTIRPGATDPLTGVDRSPDPSLDLPSGPSSLPAAPDPGSPVPGESPAVGTAEPSATASPAGPTTSPTVEAAMPVVPVIGFWGSDESISRNELEAALRGRSDRYESVIVPTGDGQAIADALGIELGGSVTEGDPDTIWQAVREGGTLGLMRASDIGPRVRALGIGESELFGTDRVDDLADWPLTIPVLETPERAWDHAATWTLAAGGDILLDRGVYVPTRIRGLGADFLFDGGTAEITGRRCCSPFFNDTYVLYRRTGDRGAMREFLEGADLTIANLENPTPPDAVFHKHGSVFTGHQWMLEGLKNAGIDYLSLANNHMKDAGDDGVVETRRALERWGFAYSGAGRDIEEAREIAVLEAGGQRIAIVPCNEIYRPTWATATRPGVAPCKDSQVEASIAEARQLADVVIVFPHWGVEYTAQASTGQREHARRWIEAGADLILGAHSHWAGAMEEVDGRLVFYSLGNFVFDQWFTERTSEGMVVELTYRGTTLVQARVHPTLIIDQGQPNFMDPAGDGQLVFKQVRRASRGLLPY